MELGQWRAGLDWGASGGTPGLPGQYVNMFVRWPDADGRHETPNHNASNSTSHLRGINFPGHFSAIKHLYFPNDMGQRSDAAFCGLHYIHYYDYTRNDTFLREVAYPYLTQVAAFYESYAVWNRWVPSGTCFGAVE